MFIKKNHEEPLSTGEINRLPHYAVIRAEVYTSVAQVYRCYDAAGRLLYVGLSVNWVVRQNQHRLRSYWFQHVARIDISHYPSRSAAAKAEAQAICQECPLHNIARYRDLLDVTQWPEWLDADTAADLLQCGLSDFLAGVRDGRYPVADRSIGIPRWRASALRPLSPWLRWKRESPVEAATPKEPAQRRRGFHLMRRRNRPSPREPNKNLRGKSWP